MVDGPYVLVPLVITDSMFGAGTTVAEPAASETAWVSGGTYAVGDLRIRATTHRVYRCVQAHTGRSQLPEVDTAYWQDFAPTQRYAPFDFYTSTAATATGSITFVLQPGFFNGCDVYGLVGTNYSFTVKDAPGGSVIYQRTGSLYEDALGYYEFYFTQPTIIEKLGFSDIPISPTAELTLTVTAGGGEPVGIGVIAVGDVAPVLTGDWGGVAPGAKAEPVTYSYIKVNDDGTITIKRRFGATDLDFSIPMPRESMDRAIAMVQRVLDVPASWRANNKPGYAGLSAFGIASASASYDSVAIATLNLRVKGVV